MDLSDAFHLPLPSASDSLTLQALLERAFPADPTAQADVKARLDSAGDPDMAEMHDALVDIVKAWRARRCSLKFFINNGPRAEPSDRVGDLLTDIESEASPGVVGRILDLVIEQRFTPLDYAVYAGWVDSKEQLVGELQAETLLYLIDSGGGVLNAEPETDVEQLLLPIAEALLERGILALSDEDAVYEITEDGADYVAEMIAETESNIELYDVFSDTVYHEDLDSASFETGRGDDLTVQVVEAEGLDPVRAVFLRALYDGTPKEFAADPAEAINGEDFYEALLMPVVDRQEVDPEALETIIESGFAVIEQGREEAALKARDRQARRTARG